MEEGCLTDSAGRRVSFKNAIVVMTSNVGSQCRGEGLGFCAEGKQSEIHQAIRQAFTPEFLGRLDQIVRFDALDACAMEAIADKYLQQLQQRTAAVGIQLQLPEDLSRLLREKCRGKGGARQMRKLVQDMVEGPLAQFLLQSARRPAKIKGTLVEEKLVF
jgi:ATP-dependent Clp protease ATP-binding subunit ClpA